jgi:hypothetical protein
LRRSNQTPQGERKGVDLFGADPEVAAELAGDGGDRGQGERRGVGVQGDDGALPVLREGKRRGGIFRQAGAQVTTRGASRCAARVAALRTRTCVPVAG